MSSNLSRDDVTEEDNLLVEAVSLLVRRQRETETWVAEQICQAEARAVVSERRYTSLETRLAGIEDQLDRLVREVGPSRGDVHLDARLARLREQVQGLKTNSDRPPAVASDSSPAEAGPGPIAPPPHGEANHVTQAPPSPASGTLGSVPSAAAATDLRSAATLRPGEATPPAVPATLTALASAPSGETNHVIPTPPASTNAIGPASVAAQPAEVASPHEVTNVPAPTAPGRVVAPGAQFSGFLELLGDTPRDRFGLILIGAGLIAVVYAVLSQLHLG